MVHTLNGTACAVPRLLIALCETHQNMDGSINIPQVLHPYINYTRLGPAYKTLFYSNNNNNDTS